MQMTLRWYGKNADTVTLKQIRQIPGVTGVITTLYDTTPGEVWDSTRIRAMKREVEEAGLKVAGIESVNVHDAIKTGAKEREEYINNYIQTLENLGKEDIHLVCYNFMPVFDWTRTELAREREDGSTVLAYTQRAVDALKPEEMFESISGNMNGTVMPGWEPERMSRVKELFEMYRGIDNERLFDRFFQRKKHSRAQKPTILDILASVHAKTEMKLLSEKGVTGKDKHQIKARTDVKKERMAAPFFLEYAKSATKIIARKF